MTERMFSMWALLCAVHAAAAATLTVTSTPPGAALSVDGAPTGAHTPVTLTGLEPGPHAVALTLAGHQPVVLHIDLGEALSLPVALVPVGQARLAVVANPATAALWLDGAPAGTGTATFPALPAGPHELRVEAAGHSPAERRFVLAPGDDRTIRVSLEPLGAPAPPPSPAAARSHRPWALGAVALGGGLLGAGAAQWATARAAWADYAAAVDDGRLTQSSARGVYERDVRPPRNRAIALGAAGAVVLGVGLAASF
jgi:hypothetical protein